jgi:hypothetical protein
VNYFYSLDEVEPRKPSPDPRFVAQTVKVRDKLRNGDRDFREENDLMRERHLGFYTTEQEADELALELLAMVGVPPGAAIDSRLRHLQLEPPPDPPAIRANECAALRELGFKDEAGRAVHVPVGDPSSAHHNTCFRVFNAAREIEAHRHPVARRLLPPGGEWLSLLVSLEAELQADKEPPKTRTGPEVAGASPGDAKD